MSTEIFDWKRFQAVHSSNLLLMRLLAVVVLCLAPLLAFAGALDGKSPGYFVDLYGPAKSSSTESSQTFIHPERGGAAIKGQFSVREYRKGDLMIRAVFFLPSLQLAGVRLQLNHSWTNEQMAAALAAYGGEWQPVMRNISVTAWVAPDGTRAINLLTWLDIQSKTVVDLMQKTLAEDDARQKAVPKF